MFAGTSVLSARWQTRERIVGFCSPYRPIETHGKSTVVPCFARSCASTASKSPEEKQSEVWFLNLTHWKSFNFVYLDFFFFCGKLNLSTRFSFVAEPWPIHSTIIVVIIILWFLLLFNSARKIIPMPKNENLDTWKIKMGLEKILIQKMIRKNYHLTLCTWKGTWFPGMYPIQFAYKA